MEFVCDDCQAQNHDACKGGTWCDCQHKTGNLVRNNGDGI